jgi:hypothetical protein
MSFVLTYQREFCGHKIKSKKENIPDMCPSCKNTGDDRTNEEKYNCKVCSDYKGPDDCRLSIFNISDINCPKKTGTEIIYDK